MGIPSPLAATSAGAAPAVQARGPRRRPDPLEIGLLALLGALSLWVVAIDVIQAAANHEVWTGTDGFFIVDQMQYLSWIQSASHHLLISNLFVLRPTPADYFQPAILISGIVVRLGVAPWLSLLLWKPVAVVAIFLAVRTVARRCFHRRADRLAALTLGLLFGSFTVIFGSLGLVGDMMTTWLSWGYPFGLMAVALVVFGLLGYDRARARGRLAWGPGLLGALAATLHPWQGELMILTIAGSELVRGRETLRWWRAERGRAALAGRAGWRGRLSAMTDPRLTLPVVTVGLIAVPLVYYLLLGHFDINWGMAREASKHTFSFWAIAIGAGPLAIVAALGYRGRPQSFLELTLRMWVPAALVIYVLSLTALSATPLHAVNGITIPLAMLAVLGVRRWGLARVPRGRLVAALVVLLATVPANAYLLSYAHTYTAPQPGNANYITRDERDALAYLRHDPVRGGVLTQFYLGATVPGRSDRKTLVGDCLWSEPNCNPNSETAEALFDGTLSDAHARAFVGGSGARFLLASCAAHPDLRRQLGPMIASVRRFGCAAVYELAPSGNGRPAPASPAVASRSPRA